ncbi:hypothetical protein TNCV_4323941 [Trichonephila clavipes]|nr:hypothetical protein TNCV_4323941 [Trichonephila clavipes]
MECRCLRYTVTPNVDPWQYDSPEDNLGWQVGQPTTLVDAFTATVERDVSGYQDLSLSDLRNVWLRHDGAPPHKVSRFIRYNRDTFLQQVVWYGGSIERPE